MSDSGAIAKLIPRQHIIELPSYAVSDIKNRLNKNGQIIGSVTEDSVPVANVAVFLMWRPTMARVARTFTDANGDYKFEGLDRELSKYVVVCQDPPGGTVYNDQVYSLVLPA